MPATVFSLDFPCALGAPQSEAIFRATPEDFIVEEQLGFLPSGEGEHVFLHVRKRGENTQWVADRIAEFAGVARQDVGFSGLKDRWAVTTQWFSVYLPKAPEPDWQQLRDASGADVELLQVARHHQKLRRGTHQSNAFRIRLSGLEAADDLAQRLQAVAATGVPNYFGEQRFGRDGGNLQLAKAWLEEGKRIKARNLRGLVTSAARSWLFNQILATRISDGSWNRVLAGEALVQDLPSAPLWGRGRSAATDEALLLEQRVLEPYGAWTNGLEHCGLNQERRPLVLQPQAFTWQAEEDALVLTFGLPPGQFATAVLRELVQLKQPDRHAATMPTAGDVL